MRYSLSPQAAGVSLVQSTFYGLILLPYLGWALGTLLGAVMGSILPAMVQSALGVAIYGMFIAIFIPPMKKSPTVTAVVLISALLSCCFTFIPLLKKRFHRFCNNHMRRNGCGDRRRDKAGRRNGGGRMKDIFLHIAVMAGVTYLVRMLPMVIFRKKIKKPFYKVVSILYSLCRACSHDLPCRFSVRPAVYCPPRSAS